jgi:manganese/zinc/iron transport system permease protein
MDAFYIILTAFLFSASCGILGIYLVLRRMAMVGDAISHAVLPGIVIAFLVSESRDSLPMILGAALLGVFTTFMIDFFHQRARLQTDAAIGVSFTSLFALGIILISVYAGQVDLDQECVLYGEIAYVPIDLWITESGQSLGPRAPYIAGIILVINLLFVGLGYKELQISTFDPAFAASIGISVSLWNYLLMGAVSMTTVAAFDSVGAILVVALLVGPPAIAYLLTEKFTHLLFGVIVISLIISVLGYYLAVALDGSIAGAIVSVAGALFGLAYLVTLARKRKARKEVRSVARQSASPHNQKVAGSYS